MKVLLIDDNKDITEMLAFYLDSHGFSCKVINDGRQGLAEIKAGRYDVVIMDLAMPGFSGYDVFNALRNDNLLSSNNLVIATASSIQDKDVEQMLAQGAKAILRKPVSLDELVETVNRFKK